MVQKKSWIEFRDSKMLWFINMILHAFGWAIVVDVIEYLEGNVVDVYPARIKFRGFSEKINTDGYIGISKYLVENAEELLKEAKD